MTQLRDTSLTIRHCPPTGVKFFAAQSKNVMDYNLYYDASGREVRFLAFSHDEWKQKGLDQNSLMADPLFVDPDNGDFSLRPESPAWQLGFQPIDLSDVGPRGDAPSAQGK